MKARVTSYVEILPYVVAVFLCQASLRAERGNAVSPLFHPTLAITEAVGEIVIDGELSDDGWREAAKADRFVEVMPGDQIKPPVETEAYITFDDANLYVAFVCYDDPASIRTSICERDQINSDDVVCLLIDTYGDAAWAYELYVNPSGIQKDMMWSADGDEDSGFDLIWTSAGEITDFGYQVEIAVPFSSLRFPDAHEQSWKVNLWRDHPRESFRQYSWAALDRNDPCWPCQWGTVTGIGGVDGGIGLEILPTLLGTQSGNLLGNGTAESPWAFSNEDAAGEISLSGKYAQSSKVVVEAVANPDFSQIEADADQIDVNTTSALFHPERRPFFQEGSDLFRTPFNAFYTRSINNPRFAGKLTARLDQTSVVFVTAWDEDSPFIAPFEESSAFLLGGSSISNVLRLRRALRTDSHAGILVTDRRLEGGGSGTLMSADGRTYVHPNVRFNWQATATHTSESSSQQLKDELDYLVGEGQVPEELGATGYTSTFDGESYWGHALKLDIEERSRSADVDLTYTEVSPTYHADNGFQSRNNRREIDLTVSYKFYPGQGPIERINPYVLVGSLWNFEHQQKDKYIWINLVTQLRVAQAWLRTMHMRSTERFHGVLYNDLWSWQQILEITPCELIHLSAFVLFGQNIARRIDVPDKETWVSAEVQLKPSDRMLIESTYDYQRTRHRHTNETLFEGYITRTKLNYQFTRELSLRLVAQYNDFRKTWDVDPLLTCRLSPFSVVYIGSTLNYARFSDPVDIGESTSIRLAERQFFVKLQYLFRL